MLILVRNRATAPSQSKIRYAIGLNEDMILNEDGRSTPWLSEGGIPLAAKEC